MMIFCEFNAKVVAGNHIIEGVHRVGCQGPLDVALLREHGRPGFEYVERHGLTRFGAEQTQCIRDLTGIPRTGDVQIGPLVFLRRRSCFVL